MTIGLRSNDLESARRARVYQGSYIGTTGWFARHRVKLAVFSDCPDNLLNLNKPEERAILNAKLDDKGGQP